MKTRIFTLFILVAFACLPLKAQAFEHNFPAGSVIIPMDAFYQANDDGGMLEVYGLAFYLLDYQDQVCLANAPDEIVVTACQAGCDGDQACESACVEAFREDCEHPIAVYWVINDQKTSVDGVDLVIEDNTLPRTEEGVTINVVVKEYDHAGGTGALAVNGAESPPDSVKRVTYRGSVFVIDVQDLAEGAEEEVYAIIDGPSWAAVNVHVAQVPFAAPVFREMRGTPPKIALMNSTEDKTKGNAAILEGYLRLAGICGESYEIVTPNEIAGFAAGDTGIPISPVLGPYGPGYDFLWAPHWVGEKDYDGTKGLAHQDDVIEQVQLFLKSGKGMLAECASIEAFEHNPNGHFLTDKGFGHNGVDKNSVDVLYTNVDAPYSQIGDFPAGFGPEGGHLHNWRPYRAGDPYNFKDDLPDVSGGNSTYNNTVKRFTIDDSDHDKVVDDTDWDYFVGGYAYGNNDYGYVLYLGGHSYADCKDIKVEKDDKDEKEVLNPEPNVHPVDIEFKEAVTNEVFEFKVGYVWESLPVLETVSFEKDGDDTLTILATDGPGKPIEIDLTGASVDQDKKLVNVILKNTDLSSSVIVATLELDWIGGDKLDKQSIKKLTDQFTDVEHIKAGSPYTFTKPAPGDPDAIFSMAPVNFTLDVGPHITNEDNKDLGCTNNSGCTAKNVAGVRYVLNTLFNIKYEMVSHEYVRSSPIVAGNYLYQGTFEHPSYFGHFRRYDVTETDPAAAWDTALSPRIIPANTGNQTGRRVYTAENNDPDAADYNADWSKTDFDAGHVAALTARLDVNDNNDTADEIKVIERLRGRSWDYELTPPKYIEQMHNKLGGIMHSAPVVIRAGNSRVDHPSLARRRETAYVGDLYGMLHAIDTETGLELWSYIPSNLLGKLQNERTDPNAEPDFAAVDGSPSARDIYWDHDADPATADQWRTILVCSQGFGGNSIFALDVTHPSDWDVLWEATNDSAPGGGMGYSFRTALDRVKVPVLDQDGNPIPGKYAVKWMVYVATSFSDIAEDHGGINVFAFDLETGIEQWVFSSTYADSVNDIPGAVTTFDVDDDTLADRIFVGDMNGRMWEIALTDDPAGNYEAGESVHEYDGPDPSDPDKTLNIPIPLYAAGIGNPISVSPAVITKNSHVILIFGTGGADWAGNDKRYHVLAVDATEAGRLTQNEKNTFYKLYGMPMEPPSDPVLTNKFVPLKLTLEPGEKVWSSPTFSAGQIWVVTTFGSMESVDPTGDKAGYSNLRLLSLDKGPEDWPDPKKIGKVRGSIFVSRKHVYMTTFDGKMLQFGDEDFTAGTGNRVVLKAWHDQ